jgi:hypothetical protein
MELFLDPDINLQCEFLQTEHSKATEKTYAIVDQSKPAGHNSAPVLS